MPRPNRGPRLKKNDRGDYEIHWTEGGRSRRKTTGTSDYGLAEETLAHFILLKKDEDYRSEHRRDRLLVVDVLGDPDEPGPDYYHEHVVPNVVGKDQVRYAYAKLKAHFGHLAVADIDPSHVADFVAKRKAGKIGRPSVNHTISRELSVLNAAINHAVKAKRLPREHQPFIKLPGHSAPRDRWLTPDEADRLLAAALASKDRACPNGKLPRIYRFVALALMTAGRKGAVRELQRKQVNLDRRIIKLNPEGRVQTKKRRVPVPISDELLPIIKRILLQIGPGEDAYLLDHPGDIRTAFENAVARAGLGPDVTPHVLRHTRATWMAQAGVSMFDLAGILGDTVETVTKTYAHHSPDYLRDAINAKPSAAHG